MSSSPIVSPSPSKPPRIYIHSSVEEHSPKQTPLIIPVIASPPSSASSPSVFSPASVADTVSTAATSPQLSSRRTSKSSWRKRSLSSIEIEESHDGKMTGRTSRQSSLSSCTSKKSTTSAKKSKSSCAEDIDWSSITDPEERRRLQNRLAQRKFREKARENKEKAERDARNQEYAGNCYHTADASDLAAADGFSGLPWGGMNLGLVMTKSNEAESRRSSGRGTYAGENSSRSGHGSVYNMSYKPTHPISTHHTPTHQTPTHHTPVLQPVHTTQHIPRGGFESSLGDDLYMVEPQYMYEPPPVAVLTSYPMMR